MAKGFVTGGPIGYSRITFLIAFHHISSHYVTFES